MRGQRLRYLREEFEYTQNFVATYLDCNRTTYANWELGNIIVPLDMVGKLAILYNTSLSYILGLEQAKLVKEKIKPIDYDYMRNNLRELKSKNNHSYARISRYIDTDKSTTNRYFNGKIKIPTDKLILLCEFYDIEIDKLCGTK